MESELTYAKAGVDYNVIDRFKRNALRTSEWTKFNITRGGFKEVSETRGGPTYLVDIGDVILAHTIEALGTKSAVADQMYQLNGRPAVYLYIGIDLVAAILNDVVTSGASPLSIAIFVGTGSSTWFDTPCGWQFLEGINLGCSYAGANWGQGETAVLVDLINNNRMVTCGSGIGIIRPKERQINGLIEHDDAIVVFESSGVHTNGLTLIRKLVEKNGISYASELSDGCSLGDHLLEPSFIYVPVVEECLNQKIPIHYANHLTGHGWAKLLRPDKPFTYVIEQLPPSLIVFDYIQTIGQFSDREMFKTFNMGAGFALYVPNQYVNQVIRIANDCPSRYIKAYHVGYIEQSTDRKVIIKPKNITFTTNDLQIR